MQPCFDAHHSWMEGIGIGNEQEFIEECRTTLFIDAWQDDYISRSEGGASGISHVSKARETWAHSRLSFENKEFEQCFLDTFKLAYPDSIWTVKKHAKGKKTKACPIRGLWSRYQAKHEEPLVSISFYSYVPSQDYSTAYKTYLEDKQETPLHKMPLVQRWNHISEPSSYYLERFYLANPREVALVLLKACFFPDETHDWYSRGMSPEDIPVMIRKLCHVFNLDTYGALEYTRGSKVPIKDISLATGFGRFPWADLKLSSSVFSCYYDGKEYLRQMKEACAAAGYTTFPSISSVVTLMMARNELLGRIQGKDVSENVVCPIVVEEHEKESVESRVSLFKVFPSDPNFCGFRSKLFMTLSWFLLLFCEELVSAETIQGTTGISITFSCLALLFSNTLQFSRAYSNAMQEMKSTTSETYASTVSKLMSFVCTYFGKDAEGENDAETNLSLDTLLGMFYRTAAGCHCGSMVVSSPISWPPYKSYLNLAFQTAHYKNMWSSALDSVSPLLFVDTDEFQGILSSILNQYGPMIHTGAKCATQVKNDTTCILYQVHQGCGYAKSVVTIDCVFRLIRNILYFEREYEWWKPSTSNAREEEREPLVLPNKDREPLNIHWSESLRMDRRSLKKDMDSYSCISLGILPLGDHRSSWFAKWSSPIKQEGETSRARGQEIRWFSQTFRLSSLCLYILNAETQGLLFTRTQRGWNPYALGAPLYPILSHVLEETLLMHEKSHGQFTSALVATNCCLVLKCLSLMHTCPWASEFGTNCIWSTMKRPIVTQNVPYAVFFVLALESLERTESCPIGRKKSAYRLFSLFCSMNAHSPISLVHEKDIPTIDCIYILSIKGKKARKTCPVLLSLLGPDSLNIQSSHLRRKTKAGKIEVEPEDDVIQEKGRKRKQDQMHEEDPLVLRESSSRWFFIDQIGSFRLLAHCCDAVWREDRGKFDTIVQEIVHHCSTIEEFHRQQQQINGPKNQAREKKRKKAPSARKVRNTHRILSSCGYDVRHQSTNEEEETTGAIQLGLYHIECKAREGRVEEVPWFTERPDLEDCPIECIELEISSREKRYACTTFGENMAIPEALPGIGWSAFGGIVPSSHAADMLYLFGRTKRGFL